MKVCFVIAYLLFAPFLGALLDGIDRIISARMQRRKGPESCSRFTISESYFQKNLLRSITFSCCLNLSYLVILVIAGALLFAGADLLMTLFILSTADMFSCYGRPPATHRRYANMGASREMLQMMAYEPMTLLLAVGFYLATGLI